MVVNAEAEPESPDSDPETEPLNHVAGASQGKRRKGLRYPIGGSNVPATDAEDATARMQEATGSSATLLGC